MTSVRAAGLRRFRLWLAAGICLAAFSGCAAQLSDPLVAETVAETEVEAGAAGHENLSERAIEELARPTDAENLAHLLFYFQAVDKLRKSGYRSELEMSAEQTAALTPFVEEVDALNAEAQDAPDDEAAAWDERYDALAKRLGKAMRQHLTREQFDRMRVELLAAQIGSTAFLMPGVPETIGLTNRQIAQISARLEAHKDELQPRNFSLWNIRKVIALGRRLRSQAEALLDDAQKDRWAQVTTGVLPIEDWDAAD